MGDNVVTLPVVRIERNEEINMDMDTSKLGVSSGSVLTIKDFNAPAMATISDKGDVAIDWQRVEQEAAGNDRLLKAVAQALIAVRDGTYKPLP